MKKGITLPCDSPDCRQIILRYANMKGEGSFEVKCQSCQKINLIVVEQKPVIRAKLIAAFLILISFGIAGIWKIQDLQEQVATLGEGVYTTK